MSKLVYLFELDSYKTTDEDISRGLEALYNEVVLLGNTVVITFNQLVESRCFLNLLSNPTYAEHILALFKQGSIKVSQFGTMRTPVQYLLSALNREGYIFSGFPLKSSQKSLIELARRSMYFCDLSEVDEYKNRRNEKDRAELFREFVDGKIIETTLSDKERITVLGNLSTMLSLVLNLSGIEHMYNPPKNGAEMKGLKLNDFLTKVIEFEDGNRRCVDWDDAIALLKSKDFDCANTNGKFGNRSAFLKILKEKAKADDSAKFHCITISALKMAACSWICKALNRISGEDCFRIGTVGTMRKNAIFLTNQTR